MKKININMFQSRINEINKEIREILKESNFSFKKLQALENEMTTILKILNETLIKTKFKKNKK